MSRSRAFLAELEQEGPSTRRVLERIPEELFPWRVHDKSFTFGELAAHVAQMVGWGADTLRGESYDVAPGGEPEPPFQPATREELLAEFDRGLAAFTEALEEATPEAFDEEWSLLSDGEPIFTMPRVAVLRTMIFNHIIHHRAQLAVYLRMHDLPVPAIYGPSADEEM